MKSFDDGGKNMFLKIEDDNVLAKYNQIWNKIKQMLSIKVHSQPVYDEKCIRTKVKTFNETVNTIFLDDKVPKEGIHYICLTAICIDSAMKKGKEKLSSRLCRTM